MNRGLICCALFVLFLATIAQAATYYVNAGATGNNTGTNWTNAWRSFSDISWAAITPGTTIAIAGGTYTTPLEIKSSGTAEQPITIKRATAADSSGVSGWNSSYDSQVIINHTDGILISSSSPTGPGRYIIVDGQTKDGIRVNFTDVSQGRGILIEGYGAFHSLFRNIGVYGPSQNLLGQTPFANDVRTLVIRNYTVDPNALAVSDITFEYDTFSGAAAFAYLIYTNNIIIQNSEIHTIETVNSAVHANLIYVMRSHNVTIRNNNFHDNAAGVGIFFTDFGSNGVQSSNIWVYGNIFRDDNGVSERFIDVRDTATGTGPLYIFNNTFVHGYGGIAINAPLNSGAESYIQNNLFVDVSAYQVLVPEGNDYVTASNNLTLDSSGYGVFVNSGSTGTLAAPYAWQYVRDLHVVIDSSPVNSGTNLSSYCTTTPSLCFDYDAVSRPQGAGFDIGSYEYQSEGTPLCTNFTYSAWSACSNDSQTRTLISSSPSGCTGGTPVTTQSCTTAITCTDFNYSSWSTCDANTQTRTVMASFPSSCTGGSPILTQSCTSSSIDTNAQNNSPSTSGNTSGGSSGGGSSSGGGAPLTTPTTTTPITNPLCSKDTDCGTNQATGNTYCIKNLVTQNYTTPTCIDSGTPTAHCTTIIKPTTITTCDTNSGCANGTCLTTLTDTLNQAAQQTTDTNTEELDAIIANPVAIGGTIIALIILAAGMIWVFRKLQ